MCYLHSFVIIIRFYILIAVYINIEELLGYDVRIYIIILLCLHFLLENRRCDTDGARPYLP